MKKILPLLLIVSAVIIVSCGKDEGGGADIDQMTLDTTNNQITFDGTTFSPSTGVIADFGTSVMPSHYQYSFGISDGHLVASADGKKFRFSTSNSFLLTFFAASKGMESFNAGTFEYAPVTSTVQENFFTLGTFRNIGTKQQSTVTDGTITISGTSPKLTLQFDLTLTGGKKLTGSFSGSFEVVPQKQ